MYRLLLISILFSLMTGCAPRAGIVVVQPNLTGSQRELHLTSNETHWAEGEQGGRVLVEFPLPGASTGKATYLLYLRLPRAADTKKKERDVKPCGFFIQTHGEYAGLTDMATGSLSIQKRDRQFCQLELNVTCDDGTRIEGKLMAKRDEHSVDHFEKQSRPADVQNLVNQCGK